MVARKPRRVRRTRRNSRARSSRSLALAMCPEHDAATNNQPNMCHFKYMLIEYAQDQFATASVKFLRSEIVLAPWASLKDGPNCVFDWWASYNNIKHKRAEYYESANLKTALELVGALLWLMLIYRK